MNISYNWLKQYIDFSLCLLYTSDAADDNVAV